MARHEPRPTTDTGARAGGGAGGGAGSDTDTGPGADTVDEQKRRFREALERKRKLEAERNTAGEGGEGSKISGAHGPARSQRSFRRKSG